MRRLFRPAAPDRRAARLLGLVVPDREVPIPTDVSGLDALRQVLASYATDRLAGQGEARESDRALRGAARRLATEARAEDATRGERLVITLRRAWRDLPEVRALGEDGRRELLWDRLVQLCCEEFYAPDSGRPTSPDGRPRLSPESAA